MTHVKSCPEFNTQYVRGRRMHGELNLLVLMYRGMEVKFQTFLTLKINVNWGSASSSSAFMPKGMSPSTPYLRSCSIPQ
jgi:hypothetical protein